MNAPAVPCVIPKERYTSPDFFNLEWERMWTRVWLLAGREADVASPGDYFTFEIGPESILVLRDAAGVIRAFYNVCMHRGTRLRHCPLGHVESLRCSYHHWDWNLDGTLNHVPDIASFAGGIPPQATRLASVRSALFAGFVWINMDPDARPLLDYLGSLAGELQPFRIESHALTRDLTVEWDCNWKVCLDNSNETYHIQGIHPELLDLVDDYNVGPRLHEIHSSFVVRFGAPSHRHPDRGRIATGLQEIMKKAGIDPSRFQGGVADVRAALMKASREKFRAEGIDYPDLDDGQIIDNYHCHIFPNVMVNFIAPSYWLFRPRPHPTDPQKMLFDFQEYERLPKNAKTPRRPEHKQYKYGEISIDSVLDQDAYILPHVQRGMRSRAFRGLVLGDQETRLRHMHEVLIRYIDGAEDRPHGG